MSMALCSNGEYGLFYYVFWVLTMSMCKWRAVIYLELKVGSICGNGELFSFWLERSSYVVLITWCWEFCGQISFIPKLVHFFPLNGWSHRLHFLLIDNICAYTYTYIIKYIWCQWTISPLNWKILLVFGRGAKPKFFGGVCRCVIFFGLA